MIALTIGACGSSGSPASLDKWSAGDLRVQVTAISDASVSAVTVAITSSAGAAYDPEDLNLAKEGEAYVGTFSKLRASSNGGPSYRLVAEAKDGVGTVLFTGVAENVVVREGTMEKIIIVANSTSAPVDVSYVPARITSVQAPSVVRSGEPLTFKVNVNADASPAVTIEWSQAGVGDAATVFTAPDLARTTWRAPDTTTFRTELITVSVHNGLAPAVTLNFWVSVTAKVDVPVEVDLNHRPVITLVGLSSARIAPNGSVTVTVEANDVDGDTLSYAFAENTCTGTLAAGSTPNAQVFTAGGVPSVCSLKVTVSDGRGLSADGFITVVVDPLAPARVFVVTPTAPYAIANVVGVADPAPGMGTGSLEKLPNGSKAEIYFARAGEPFRIDRVEVLLNLNEPNA